MRARTSTRRSVLTASIGASSLRASIGTAALRIGRLVARAVTLLVNLRLGAVVAQPVTIDGLHGGVRLAQRVRAHARVALIASGASAALALHRALGFGVVRVQRQRSASRAGDHSREACPRPCVFHWCILPGRESLGRTCRLARQGSASMGIVRNWSKIGKNPQRQVMRGASRTRASSTDAACSWPRIARRKGSAWRLPIASAGPRARLPPGIGRSSSGHGYGTPQMAVSRYSSPVALLTSVRCLESVVCAS